MSPHCLVKSRQATFNNKSSLSFVAANQQILKVKNLVYFFNFESYLIYALTATKKREVCTHPTPGQFLTIPAVLFV